MLDGRLSTSAIWSEIDGNGELSYSPSTAVGVLGACIGALVSGMEGHRVELPIDPVSDRGRQEWPIS
jgi:hypothetical protein